MIEINLLPEETKKKKRPAPKIDASVINLPSMPVINIAFAAVGALLAIQLALFMIGIVSGATLKFMTLEYKGILPKKQETENLKIQVDAINKKVAVIDELMVKRFIWEKKLNALSDSMTAGIWLTKLEYDEKLISVPDTARNGRARKNPGQAVENILSGYLVLSGAASGMGEEGTALIGRFIKSLKDDPYFYSDFSDIELAAIKTEKVYDQEIMVFEIICFFKAKR